MGVNMETARFFKQDFEENGKIVKMLLFLLVLVPRSTNVILENFHFQKYTFWNLLERNEISTVCFEVPREVLHFFISNVFAGLFSSNERKSEFQARWRTCACSWT